MGRAPLDTGSLEAALAPHGRSVMLPAAAYLHDDVYAWELRNLFGGAWTCIGRRDELLAAPVTHRAVAVGDVGVLLTCSGTQVRAFANVCRHRGHELLPIGGYSSRPGVVCPYHGWGYRLDGGVLSAPGVCADGLGLVELPAAVWHGWLFVNATGDAPPFDRYLGDLDPLISAYRPGELVLGARHEYEVAANWKVLVENYHECYHCPQIHPELCGVSPPDSGVNWELPGVWVGGDMDLRDGAVTMSLDGRSGGRMLSGVDSRTVRYVGLFPNLLLSAHPDYLMAHRLLPLAPGRTAVECSWYFPPGVADPSYAVDFWDVTNRQDWTACESVQRGLANPHHRPGPLAAKEDAVYQWVTLLARLYLDPAGALAAACTA